MVSLADVLDVGRMRVEPRQVELGRQTGDQTVFLFDQHADIGEPTGCRGGVVEAGFRFANCGDQGKPEDCGDRQRRQRGGSQRKRRLEGKASDRGE
jgi:hypothetical protein